MRLWRKREGSGKKSLELGNTEKVGRNKENEDVRVFKKLREKVSLQWC